MKRLFRLPALLLMLLLCTWAIARDITTAAFDAIRSGKAQEVRRLLASGVDATARAEDGPTLLMAAAFLGSKASANPFFMSFGAASRFVWLNQ